MSKKKRFAVPADWDRVPGWRDLPVLLYNIWAALDEIQETNKKMERHARDTIKAADRATDQANLRFLQKRKMLPSADEVG